LKDRPSVLDTNWASRLPDCDFIVIGRAPAVPITQGYGGAFGQGRCLSGGATGPLGACSEATPAKREDWQVPLTANCAKRPTAAYELSASRLSSSRKARTQLVLQLPLIHPSLSHWTLSTGDPGVAFRRLKLVVKTVTASWFELGHVGEHLLARCRVRCKSVDVRSQWLAGGRILFIRSAPRAYSS